MCPRCLCLTRYSSSADKDSYCSHSQKRKAEARSPRKLTERKNIKLFSKPQRFAKKLQRSGCYTVATVKEKSRGSEPSDNDGRGLSCEAATGDGTDQTSRSYTRNSAEQRGWTNKTTSHRKEKSQRKKHLNLYATESSQITFRQIRLNLSLSQPETLFCLLQPFLLSN